LQFFLTSGKLSQIQNSLVKNLNIHFTIKYKLGQNNNN